MKIDIDILQFSYVTKGSDKRDGLYLITVIREVARPSGPRSPIRRPPSTTLIPQLFIHTSTATNGNVWLNIRNTRSINHDDNIYSYYPRLQLIWCANKRRTKFYFIETLLRVVGIETNCSETIHNGRGICIIAPTQQTGEQRSLYSKCSFLYNTISLFVLKVERVNSRIKYESRREHLFVQ